jgi:hypothetical protein
MNFDFMFDPMRDEVKTSFYPGSLTPISKEIFNSIYNYDLIPEFIKPDANEIKLVILSINPSAYDVQDIDSFNKSANENTQIVTTPYALEVQEIATKLNVTLHVLNNVKELTKAIVMDKVIVLPEDIKEDIANYNKRKLVNFFDTKINIKEIENYSFITDSSFEKYKEFTSSRGMALTSHEKDLVKEFNTYISDSKWFKSNIRLHNDLLDLMSKDKLFVEKYIPHFLVHNNISIDKFNYWLNSFETEEYYDLRQDNNPEYFILMLFDTLLKENSTMSEKIDKINERIPILINENKYTFNIDKVKVYTYYILILQTPLLSLDSLISNSDDVIKLALSRILINTYLFNDIRHKIPYDRILTNSYDHNSDFSEKVTDNTLTLNLVELKAHNVAMKTSNTGYFIVKDGILYIPKINKDIQTHVMLLGKSMISHYHRDFGKYVNNYESMKLYQDITGENLERIKYIMELSNPNYMSVNYKNLIYVVEQERRSIIHYMKDKWKYEKFSLIIAISSTIFAAMSVVQVIQAAI